MQQSESLSRTTRLLFQKAGKALAIANSQAAKQEAEIARLQHQLEASAPQKKRKRITIDQNQRFADVESIKRAIDSAAAEEAQISTPVVQKAVAAVRRIATTATIESMCTQFQI
jgi:hypothetical protein